MVRRASLIEAAIPVAIMSGVIGCGGPSHTAAAEGCQIVNETGQTLHPTTYKLGRTTVIIAVSKDNSPFSSGQIFNEAARVMPGDDGDFLMIPHMPAPGIKPGSLAALDNFPGETVHVGISPGTAGFDNMGGELGVTDACIGSLNGVDSLQPSAVYLPNHDGSIIER